MVSNYYEWYKALHLIFLISWMAALLYLPRLYVYHTDVVIGSDEDKRFQLMERRLLRVIMNPAMILTIFFGILLAYIYGFKNLGMWFHIKMLCVIILVAVHGFLAKCRKNFVLGKNKYSSNFFRIVNELPTILMVIAVFLVIIKPFES